MGTMGSDRAAEAAQAESSRKSQLGFWKMTKRKAWALGMTPPLVILTGTAWAHMNRVPGVLTSYGIDFVLSCSLAAGIYQLGEKAGFRRGVLLALAACAALCFCSYEVLARARGVGTFDPLDMFVYASGVLYATVMWAVAGMFFPDKRREKPDKPNRADADKPPA